MIDMNSVQPRIGQSFYQSIIITQSNKYVIKLFENFSKIKKIYYVYVHINILNYAYDGEYLMSVKKLIAKRKTIQNFQFCSFSDFSLDL